MSKGVKKSKLFFNRILIYFWRSDMIKGHCIWAELYLTLWEKNSCVRRCHGTAEDLEKAKIRACKPLSKRFVVRFWPLGAAITAIICVALQLQVWVVVGCPPVTKLRVVQKSLEKYNLLGIFFLSKLSVSSQMLLVKINWKWRLLSQDSPPARKSWLSANTKLASFSFRKVTPRERLLTAFRYLKG